MKVEIKIKDIYLTGFIETFSRVGAGFVFTEFSFLREEIVVIFYT